MVPLSSVGSFRSTQKAIRQLCARYPSLVLCTGIRFGILGSSSPMYGIQIVLPVNGMYGMRLCVVRCPLPLRTMALTADPPDGNHV